MWNDYHDQVNTSISTTLHVLCAKLLQSCPTLCDPMDCSPPGSSVHRILQARILEWVAMSFSRGSSWPRARTHISCVSCIILFTTSTTREAPSLWYPPHLKVKVLVAHLHGLWPSSLLYLLDTPGKNTGVGCHALLQGIFLTQGSNSCLLCLLHQQGCSSPLAPPGKSHPSGTHHIYCTLIFCSHICLPHKILSSADKNQVMHVSCCRSCSINN